MAFRASPTVSRERPTYTAEQLHQFYERIDLPNRYRYEPGPFSQEVVKQLDGHGFLGALQRHTLANIPFENLQLHYSTYHGSSVHPADLFEKIVTSGRGRGGYCMENNVLLGTVLRSLGYSVVSLGARVNVSNQHNGGDGGHTMFGGWSHMINLVSIRGEQFLVDVGFGAGGPTQPILLADGQTSTAPPFGQTIQLRRDTIPEAEHPTTKMWIVERKEDGDRPWMPLYCFQDDICFLPQDFEVMNYYTTMNRTSFYTYRVICSKYIIDAKAETFVGDVVLYDNQVVARIPGRRAPIEELKTESARIEALEKYMDITLTEAEQASIMGMVTELHGD